MARTGHFGTTDGGFYLGEWGSRPTRRLMINFGFRPLEETLAVVF